MAVLEENENGEDDYYEEQVFEDDDNELDITDDEEFDFRSNNSSQELYENYSIVRQKARDFQLILEPPEIEIPVREYSQRSEKSGLADGIYTIDNEAPIGESLAQAIWRLSKQANEIWKLWTQTTGDPFVLDNQIINSLDRPLEELLLSEQERIDYIRTRRLLLVEDGRFKKEQQALHQRAIDETKSFGTREKLTTSVISNTNRYYEQWSSETDEFGETRTQKIKKDRCEGKPQLTINPNTYPSNIEMRTFSPSYSERKDMLNLSDHETAIWRKENRAEEKDLFFPSTGPSDDPDFTPPSALSSRNFVIYPPVSRPYNCTFSVFKDDKVIYKIHPIRGKKDYTSLSTIIYNLKQKKINFTKVEISKYIVQNQEVSVCNFEIDIRVTYGPDLKPNPINYKKVDPESPLGIKFLLLLNEQPYLFTEYYINTEEEVDGQKETVKKLMVGLKVENTNDTIGPRVYWVYVNDKPGKPNFLRKKMVAPQYIYHTLKNYKEYENLPNYLKVEHPLGATVRVTRGYYYFDKNLKNPKTDSYGRWVNFKEVEDNFVNVLDEKGYKLIAIKPESITTEVILYKFIHQSVEKVKDRNKITRSLVSQFLERNPND